MRRVRNEFNRDVSIAWHMAALQRQKKLPALKTLLRQGERGEQQTASQHRAALAVLSEQYGLPLRKASQRKKKK